MSTEGIPIILIHYGDSFYLKYVVMCIKLTNPNKKVYFLGDDENSYLSRLGIDHIHFNKYLDKKSVLRFNSVFKLIAGKNHQFNKNKGTDFWVRFVFLRWFLLYEFVKDLGIERFWTFDSDNMIVRDLRVAEKDLQEYDCTTQCHGSCMNGLINNTKVVKGYLDKIVTLFLDTDYLNRQRVDMHEHANFAYTEMRAFDEYKKTCDFKSIHLEDLGTQPYLFDDCLVLNHPSSRFEMYRYSNTTIKSIYLHNSSFCFNLKGYGYVPTMNLNLSWLDDFIFRIVLLQVFLPKKTKLKNQLFNFIFISKKKNNQLILKRSLAQRIIVRIFFKVCF